MRLTIAPLSASNAQTVEAWSRITDARRLFLQTERHPFAAAVREARPDFTSMDDLYESAGDFDALHRAMAERLLAAGGDCVYAATGETDALLAALLPLAERAGAEVEVLPGVPLYVAAFPDAHADMAFAAAALPDRLDPSKSIAVTEIDTALRAGEVKLALSEYYPDDWIVRLAGLDQSGAYAARQLPLCALDRQKHYDAATALFVPAVPFDALTRYGVEELSAVIDRLRGPGGCPWDREQTHESMKGALLEECYEVLDAIDQKDDAALCEELGDVMLQVVFHAAIAESQGRFTVRDVATGIVQKLIYRHPHVFGSVKADTAEQVLVNWDRLKKAEKHQQTQTDAMKSVPRGFPALMRSRKVQKKAADVGFDWDSAEAAFPKISEEAEELRAAMGSGEGIAEEMGDLLFAVVNVARLLHLEPEFLLQEATDKFIGRFSAMEALALSRGTKLENLSFSEQDELWSLIKNTENRAKIHK